MNQVPMEGVISLWLRHIESLTQVVSFGLEFPGQTEQEELGGIPEGHGWMSIPTWKLFCCCSSNNDVECG